MILSLEKYTYGWTKGLSLKITQPFARISSYGIASEVERTSPFNCSLKRKLSKGILRRDCLLSTISVIAMME